MNSRPSTMGLRYTARERIEREVRPEGAVQGGGRIITIPDAFWAVRYDGTRYPGAPGVVGTLEGANCQLFAYALLRHFSLVLPTFRSSELWGDTRYTARIAATMTALEPLDLLLFNKTNDPWGAHVGVHVGDERAVHLSKRVGAPAVWTLAAFASRPEYCWWLGAKRVSAVASKLAG